MQCFANLLYPNHGLSSLIAYPIYLITTPISLTIYPEMDVVVLSHAMSTCNVDNKMRRYMKAHIVLHTITGA